jgi:hypothetical protein
MSMVSPVHLVARTSVTAVRRGVLVDDGYLGGQRHPSTSPNRFLDDVFED